MGRRIKNDDLISRQDALDALARWDWQDLYLPVHFRDMLLDLPTVHLGRAMPVEGHWIIHQDSGAIECSECHEAIKAYPQIGFIRSKAGIKVLFDFCPYCGTDMRWEDERFDKP